MSSRPAAFAAALIALAALNALPASALRLPTDVVPTFQSVHLQADADSAHYSGTVHVELNVRKATSTFQLYALGQTLESVTLTQKGKSIGVKHSTAALGLLTLATATPLAPGKAALDIRFTNPFNTQAVGLYRTTKDGLGYTFTQFESDEARKAFPCWDEPSFKIPWQMTLEVPERHEAVFNTPIERQSTKDGWKTLVFKRTPPMPSYLLAIATGPLEFVPIQGLSVPGRIVTARGQSHLAGQAAEWTPRVLAACEAWFGQKYPYEKLDLIGVPEFWAGAMENPGAITYADRILLLDPRTTSPTQRRSLVRITAHEIAHMWFGDLVTMAWWDDLWLNESFADWMGDKITDQLMPEAKQHLDGMHDAQGIMVGDARPSTDAIRQQVENGQMAMRNVGLAYNKGKRVLGWFEDWMGAETFQRGVREYLEAHEWKNAVAADLWRALGKASGKDVAGTMGAYIEQPGFALVSVEPLGNGSVRLSQRRFTNHGVQAPDQTWRIPMTLLYSDGKQSRTTRVLLESASQTVSLPDASTLAWVMPNGGGRGYYRWKVPAEMLAALTEAAPKSLSPAERIAFLGNLSSLLDAGEIRGDAFLAAIGVLADDPEPVVALEALTGLEKVRSAFIADDMRDAFAGYVRRTLRPMAERYGLEKKAGEEETVSGLRPQMLAWLGREGHDESTLRFAGGLAAKYEQDPASVDPALAGTALQLAALQGDRALYDRYRSAFEGAKQPAVRNLYLNALGAFRDRQVQEQALAYALEGPLRPNELMTIPRGIAAQSDQGTDRLLRWVEENYDKLKSRFPETGMARLASTCRGCSAERLARGKAFFGDPARAVAGTKKELTQAEDQVNDCVGLRAREGAGVAAYLKRLAAAN